MTRKNTRLPFALSRRQMLMTTGASVVAAGAFGGRGAFAAERLTVADPGGPFKDAFAEAFYRPFEQANEGIEIINIAREHQPTSQVQAIVDTGSYTWDVVTVTQADQVLLGERDMLEPLDWSGEHMDDIIPEARTEVWMGTDVYATILAYRSDTLGKAPQSWADFWDVENFPGRRALRRSPIDTLEIALLADGVPPEELYPLDIERALNKLSEIRPHVDVWWTGGAQTSQLLQTGEVDMLPTWNGRAQTVIDEGTPVGIQWNQGLYSIEGWAIPKGNPHADLGREFIKFSADPERQADFTDKLAYGPTNPKAYDFIPAERAEVLPTAPQNFEKMILADQQWWGEHKEEAEQRFNEWLLT